MTTANLLAPWLLAIHLLGAVAWVGGMVFAVMVFRPGLSVLEPGARTALHLAVFARFFRLVWHAMPLVLLSGYAMLFWVYGGFAHVAWPVHVMHLLGVVMALMFVAMFFGPWKTLRGEGDGAAGAVARIRGMSNIILVLGLATVAVAAFAS